MDEVIDTVPDWPGRGGGGLSKVLEIFQNKEREGRFLGRVRYIWKLSWLPL